METQEKSKKESVMDFPLEVTFLDENIEKNLSYLENLNGNNKIYNKAYNGKTNFSDEVNDLFYFYNDKNYFVKNIFRSPSIREDHDKRLSELEEVLNGVDLSTIEDKETRIYLEEDFSKNLKRASNPAPAPWLRAQVLPAALASLNRIRYEQGIKGNMDLDNSENALSEGINTKYLYSKPLKKALKKSKIYGLTLNTFPIAASGILYAYSGEILGSSILFGILEAYNLHCNKVMSQSCRPLGYKLLKEKSKRMDEFIEKYVKEKK